MAGRDYPRTWGEFLEWFPDEEACLEYLERLRWRDGFTCSKCGEARAPYRSTRGRLVCRACRHQATVSAGTIFDTTRTPLMSWFAAVWYVTNQKYGVSAMGLKQALGFGSYQTAWTILHKLRRAMVRPGRNRLSGVVEVDESYVGGEEKGVSGREPRFTPTVGAATTSYPSTATRTGEPSSLHLLSPRMFRCQQFTELHLCSSDGCLARTREVSAPSS